jgi:gluconolactonase
MRWLEDTGEVSVFRSPSNNSNGNTRDLQGRLLTCERRRVTRTEYDGSITVLIDQFEGKRLNSPNDPVVHPDGHIWFADPGYGSLGWYEGRAEELELPTSVYRLNPETGEATVMTTNRNRPNGICFSPDFSKLYVADTGGAEYNVYVYDVVNSSRLENERGFYKMSAGGVDGVRCDVDGNVWSGAGWGGQGIDGVHCLAPDGTLIGQIHLPETCANVCFGGEKHNRLFMASSQSLYAVYVETQGARSW